MSYYVLKKVTLRLGLYVRAWIFDATFVGVMIGFGFYFIGVPNALPLGVIAGLGHLIPYFGPIIGGIPAIIVSIVQYGNFSQVPLILFVVLITYAFDNGFVQPYILGKSPHASDRNNSSYYKRWNIIWIIWDVTCDTSCYSYKNLLKRNLLCKEEL